MNIDNIDIELCLKLTITIGLQSITISVILIMHSLYFYLTISHWPLH